MNPASHIVVYSPLDYIFLNALQSPNAFPIIVSVVMFFVSFSIIRRLGFTSGFGKKIIGLTKDEFSIVVSIIISILTIVVMI